MALGAALALAACGYRPAFAPGSTASGLLEGVAVDAPGTRDAFSLVQRLEERLGRTGTPRFRLSYRIETDETGLAITPAGAITRFNVTGSVAYSLTRAEDGGEVAAGRVSSFTSYAASGTTVSTGAARSDAYLRLMRILADRIVTELVAKAGAA
jgi:LPS-assembly lipoprotein